MDQFIKIINAREHNLKNVSLEIPKNKLVIFTGLSGSGKSSLAYDTIYAEGQRRYVESLSSYARQFLGIMDKPDVDKIEGLSPAISIDQKSTSHNPRSTIGTITEIYDYLRLLYARIGHPHCPSCGREIERQTSEQIVNKSFEMLERLGEQSKSPNQRLIILSPIIRDRRGEFTSLFDNLRQKGFSKVRIDSHFFDLNEDISLIKTNKHTIDVVIDRLVIERKKFKDDNDRKVLRTRLFEAIEQSTALSEGLVIIGEVKDPSFSFPEKPKKVTDHLFSQRFACPFCNISMSEIEPRIFSFNSPHGACPNCMGIGSLQKVKPVLVINRNLSITEGAILPFAKQILNDTWYARILSAACKYLKIEVTKPLNLVSADKLNSLLYGTGDELFEVSGTNRQGRVVTIHEIFSGVVPELEKRYSETDSDWVRNEIRKYLREEICGICQGKRLKKEALSVTIGQMSIVDITAYSITEVLAWLEKIILVFTDREKIIANLIIKEIKSRLSFLSSVGLTYLTLDRKASSLSGGEIQRIRLASQIGSGLTGVLYVLDEPSIGLHPKDNSMLIQTLKKLRDLGNTVIVVEHDREMMENADLIVDFGPGAGEQGGNIVSYGTYDQIISDKKSETGKYLSYKKDINIKTGKAEQTGIKRYLRIMGCEENNLKKIDVSFPLNQFICVTGVSGSGKSTLIVDTLYHALASYFNPYHKNHGGKYSKVEGLEYLRRVILIDQSPIGRTPRSNPVTYTGAFSHIRDIFSMLPYSRARGYNPGRFSFNVKGGRCEQCEGEGHTKIEMQFLPDVYVKCDLCKGTRFNSETLEVKYKEKNIAQILDMTVAEAMSFFRNIPVLSNKLETLFSVGLSYIRLGQPATQLSGGEAQRIKLAAELSKKGTRDTIFILDEPTTGLHFADLEKLLYVLRSLTEMGNTVIVIEHNLDVIKNADYIIDLGPEGGDFGGEVIVSGKPLEIIKNMNSYTGKFLKPVLLK